MLEVDRPVKRRIEEAFGAIKHQEE